MMTLELRIPFSLRALPTTAGSNRPNTNRARRPVIPPGLQQELCVRGDVIQIPWHARCVRGRKCGQASGSRRPVAVIVICIAASGAPGGNSMTMDASELQGGHA